MSNFILSVDSTTPITDQQKKDNDIIITPLHYTLDGIEKLDQYSSEQEKTSLYQSLRDGSKAMSSKIAPFDFISNWKPYLRSGKDILHISLSSNVSGCFDSANLAKKDLEKTFPQQRIEIIDSLTGCFSVTNMALECRELGKQGKTLDEIIKITNEKLLNHNLIFTVDDIGHLHRGGRIGHAKAILGGALNLKPVLYISSDGKINHLSSARGRKKSFIFLLDTLEKTMTKQTTWLSIAHGGDEKIAQSFKEKVMAKFENIKEIDISIMSPVLGLHSGPGSLAISYYGKVRESVL